MLIYNFYVISCPKSDKNRWFRTKTYSIEKASVLMEEPWPFLVIENTILKFFIVGRNAGTKMWFVFPNRRRFIWMQPSSSVGESKIWEIKVIVSICMKYNDLLILDFTKKIVLISINYIIRISIGLSCIEVRVMYNWHPDKFLLIIWESCQVKLEHIRCVARFGTICTM